MCSMGSVEGVVRHRAGGEGKKTERGAYPCKFVVPIDVFQRVERASGRRLKW